MSSVPPARRPRGLRAGTDVVGVFHVKHPGVRCRPVPPYLRAVMCRVTKIRTLLASLLVAVGTVPVVPGAGALTLNL